MEIVVGDNVCISGISSQAVLPIYIAHSGQFFPCEGWMDFACILDMWKHSLLQNEDCKAGKFTMYFMDGPYRLDIEKSKNDLTISCVDFHSIDITQQSISCTYAELLEAVHKASCQLEKVLKRQGDG